MHTSHTEALAARRYLYKAFSGIFGGEPTQAFPILYDASLLIQSFDTTSRADCPESFTDLCTWLKDETVDFADMVGLYNRLFVGPGTPIALPWESMYVTNDKRIFGPIALEVRKAYRDQGMLPQEYPHVSDDNLALELDFMYVLGERSLTQFLEGSDEQAALSASLSFLQDHLLRWVSSCSSNIQEYQPDTFYAVAACALDDFLHIDEKFLAAFFKPQAARSTE